MPEVVVGLEMLETIHPKQPVSSTDPSASFLPMTTFTNPGHRPAGCSTRGYDFLIQPGRPQKKNVRCQTHRCPICRRYFFTNHEKQTFCSVPCWLTWLREHSRRAICPACKREFNPHRTGRGGVQRCCSRRCAGFFSRGLTNSHWKHGRYALSIPAEIQPETPIRKRRMGTKRRIRTPLERQRLSEDLASKSDSANATATPFRCSFKRAGVTLTTTMT